MSLNVAFLTTWGAKCGISTYSEQLIPALRSTGLTVDHVFAPNEIGTLTREPGVKLTAHTAWDRGLMRGGADVAELVRKHKIDLVHIQHEFGLFPSQISAFAQLCHDIQRAGAKVIVTLHTLFANRYAGTLVRMNPAVDYIIVHTPEALARVSQFTADVAMIAHGTPLTPFSPTNMRDELKLLKNDVVGLALGFQNRGKNIVQTIAGVSELASSRLTLLIAGTVPETFHSALLHELEYSGINYRFLNKFIPVADIPKLLATANFGILNTQSDNLSASGQVHLLAGAGLPILAARRPIYSDAIRAGGLTFEVDAHSPEHPTPSLVDGLRAMSESSVRAWCGNAAANYARLTCWQESARAHSVVYDKVGKR